MHRVPITIRLESFEGPLDLLLYLIQSHELDISKVSIGKITDQYLAYVKLMQELNFDIASDFLVMAATLLHWKSKALLPQEKDPNAEAGAEDGLPLSQEDLLRQLMELERFRRMGEDLAQCPKLGEDVFTRPNRKPPVGKRWREMDITQLAMSYQDSIVRARKRSTILKKETVSITSKIEHFKQRLKMGKLTALQELLDLGEKTEVVVTFLASLELSRLKKLKLHQNETYAPIYLELMESLENFDTKLASGFDSITDQVQAELGLASGPDLGAGAGAESGASGVSAGSDSAASTLAGGDAGSTDRDAAAAPAGTVHGIDLATHDFFGAADRARAEADASRLGAGASDVPVELLAEGDRQHGHRDGRRGDSLDTDGNTDS